MITRDQIAPALTILAALADAIRELKRIPSGHLYALLMPKMSLAQYETAIDLLIKAGLVRKASDELVWEGRSV